MRSAAIAIVAVLSFAACARKTPPANSAPDAKVMGDESERQSHRADVDRAVDSSAHVSRP